MLRREERSTEEINVSNAFAKHLQVHHPDREGDPSAFEFKVIRNFKKPLDRQVYEGVRINKDSSEILMNSKSEYHQPAETRVTTTREVRNGGR